jgi:IS30 family transposase
MSLDELIKAAHQLDETDLDQFLQQIAVLRTQRKAHVSPTAQAHLLDQINQGIPNELRRQYQSLYAKREAETLTEAEHQTLVQLSSQIEALGAQRLEALAQLAQLRQVSLSELMATLGIQPTTCV